LTFLQLLLLLPPVSVAVAAPGAGLAVPPGLAAPPGLSPPGVALAGPPGVALAGPPGVARPGSRVALLLPGPAASVAPVAVLSFLS